MKIKRSIYPLLQVSFTVSVASLTVGYWVAYYLMTDGLSTMEVAYTSVSFGIVYFVSILILAPLLLNYSYRNTNNEEANTTWYYQWLMLSLFILSASCLLDSFFFFFIDDSISKAYAEGIKNVPGTAENDEAIQYFFSLPHFLQNYVVNTVVVLVATLLSTSIASSVFKASLRNDVNVIS